MMEVNTAQSDRTVNRQTAVEISEISHFYNNLKAVDDVSIKIYLGESVGIVGPSGAGKSTLLRLAIGVESPSGGQVEVGVKHSEIGAAFQEDNLLPWLTVAENICLLHVLNRKVISKAELAEVLKLAGLEVFKDYFPWQLSTGMKQKVSLIRLLTYNPLLYVLDEAMANIDDFSRFAFCDEFYSRVRNQGKSICFITHNLMDALHMADRILICSERPLRIIHKFVNPLPRKRNYTIRFTVEFQQALEKLRTCTVQL